jgi:uncharacterized protein
MVQISGFNRLDQKSAAKLMQLSRQTYGRILSTARGIVGEALVTGKALKITGGNYAMCGGGRRHRGRWGRKGGEKFEHNEDVGQKGRL